MKAKSNCGCRFLATRSPYIFIFFIATFQLLAQSDVKKFITTQYTTESGLPQNSIKGLAFDNLGYCWIGTENGLVKYDGVHFRQYDTYDIPPVSSRVSYVKQNRHKEILIAFEGEQFYKIKEFANYGTRPVRVKGNYLVSDYPGFEDVSSESARYFFKQIQKNRLEFSSDACFIINDHQFYLIKPDTLWIGNKHKGTTCIIDKRFGQYPTTTVGDQLILFLNNHKAIQYSNPNEHVRLLTTKGLFFDQIEHNAFPYSFMCIASGTYSFCQGRLYKLTLTNQTIYSTLIVEGLTNFTPNSLYFDEASDTYYLQSAIDGLLVIRPNCFQQVRIPNGTWRQNSFYGQSRYGKNQIVANGSLFTFGNKGKSPTIQNLISFPYSFISTCIQGDYYYYEKGSYLRKFNLVTGQEKIVAYVNDYIHCFNRSPFDSTTYFSTSSKLYSFTEDKTKCIFKLPQMTNRYIYGFSFVSIDSLLIATNFGLLGANLRTRRIKTIIPKINIRNIYADKEGYFWLGTYNDGIYLLKSGMARQLPLDNNKRLRVVNSIVEDRQGRIWFSTNNGLLCTKRNSIIRFFHGSGSIEPYTIYTKSDGLVTNEFNGGAFPDKVYLSDGRVSLPSMKGLVIFNPDDFPIDRSSKRVFIDYIKVDGKSIRNLSKLVLAPDYNSMTISVSAPWKNKAEALLFERMVVGHDREWISFQHRETINVRDYAHGNYHINIRIKGYPQSQITLRFRIEPYYYETIWFKLAIALCILLVVLAVFSYTISYYRRKTISLDQKVKERTLELDESLEHLSLTVERLQFVETRLQASLTQKDRIIKMLLHDMKSPLFALKNGIEELDSSLSQQTGLTDMITRKSQLLREGINDIYSFSVNFFEWIKYQQEGFSANYQLTRLADVFSKIYELYGGIATGRKISLIVAPTDAIFYTDENILITILRNLVDNAIKHSQGDLIRLYAVSKKDEYLVITVHDNGSGMDIPTLMKIQDAFNEGYTISDHAGYGYKLTLHLVNLIHGDLELENKAGFQAHLVLNFGFGQQGPD